MTSARQIEANRANALSSTGPKSDPGKQRASQNAIRHGLTAETVILPLENPDDPSTQVNRPLIETLRAAETVLIAGEAGSHCVANTVRDIAAQFGDDLHLSRLILLTDAFSPVAGFESLQEDFVSEMTARGIRMSTTVDLFS